MIQTFPINVVCEVGYWSHSVWYICMIYFYIVKNVFMCNHYFLLGGSGAMQRLGVPIGKRSDRSGRGGRQDRNNSGWYKVTVRSSAK